MQTITLNEEEDLALTRDALPEHLILSLCRSHKEQISVDFPNPMNNYCYVLRSKGYVGQIPLSNDVIIKILPKVHVSNIFRMLEYTYKLKSFQLLKGITEVESLEDLFERLVSILAKRVLDRARKGLYRSYVREEECSHYQRGRILLIPTLRRMQRASLGLECEYEEHTEDLIDNQILIWTLFQLPRFGLKREDVRRIVRQAYHTLASSVSINHIEPQDCLHRFYHRLNDDYKPMHGLCRFFLEHSGPGLEKGSHNFIPFLVNMPRLFEAFIAELLKADPPGMTYVKPQYEAHLDPNGVFSFRIDLVLNDLANDLTLAVLDTKYKRESRPVEEDIKDIVAYAVRMDTTRGFLVYPSHNTESVSLKVGNIRIRTLGFDIGRDPNEEYNLFIEEIRASLSKER